MVYHRKAKKLIVYNIGGKQFSRSDLKLESVLLSLYGIGPAKAKYLVHLLGFTNRCKLLNVNRYKLSLLNFYLKFYTFGDDLLEIEDYFLRSITFSRNYRSYRYLFGLPANGQRTHGNSKTSRSKIGRYYRK